MSNDRGSDRERFTAVRDLSDSYCVAHIPIGFEAKGLLYLDTL